MENFKVETEKSMSSDTYPIQVSGLRKNGYAVMNGRPCKIIDMSAQKSKHEDTKVHIIGIDIFTHKKIEGIFTSTHNIDVPNVTKINLILLDIGEDNFLNLMFENGDMKNDIKLPESDLGGKIQADFDAGKELVVTVLSAMGEEAAVESYTVSNG